MHGTTIAHERGCRHECRKSQRGYDGSCPAASRFVRFETGRSSEAEFASHTVVSAKGIAGSPTCRASTTTTGVSNTARGVERQEDRARRREHDDEQPEQPCPPEPPAREPLRDHREQTGRSGELGDDGHRHHEHQDGPDPLSKGERLPRGQDPARDREHADDEKCRAQDRSAHRSPFVDFTTMSWPSLLKASRGTVETTTRSERA